MVRGAPGHPMDVGAADADVGELAVAQPRQFGQAAVVALPLPDQANDVGKHTGIFLNKPAPRPGSIHPKNRRVPQNEKQ